LIGSVVHFDSRRVKLAKLVKENDQRKAGESRLESVCTHSTVGYDSCDHRDPTLHKRTLHQDTNNQVIKIPHWELIDTEVSRRFKKVRVEAWREVLGREDELSVFRKVTKFPRFPLFPVIPETPVGFILLTTPCESADGLVVFCGRSILSCGEETADSGGRIICEGPSI
jgi:hypothetical protein